MYEVSTIKRGKLCLVLNYSFAAVLCIAMGKKHTWMELTVSNEYRNLTFNLLEFILTASLHYWKDILSVKSWKCELRQTWILVVSFRVIFLRLLFRMK